MLVAAIVGAVVALLYVPTLKFGFTNLDDVNLIVGQARFLREPSSFFAVFGRTYFPNPECAYYRPLVGLSIVADYHWGQKAPFVYHLTNCLMHAFVSVLVYIFLYNATVRLWPALLGSLFFAFAPVQVASVAWIPGRNDLLLGMFAVASFLFLRDTGRPRRACAVAHFACFAAALLCKETALCLPLAYAPWVLGQSPPRWRLLALGWAILLLAYCAVHAVVAPPRALASHLAVSPLELHVLLGEIGKLSGLSAWQAIAEADDVRVGWTTVIVLGFCVAPWFVRGVSRAKLGAALALVILPLLMTLPSSKTVVLENWLYLPTMGLALTLSLTLARFEGMRRLQWVAYALVLVLVFVFGIRSVRRSGPFADPERFSEAALQGSPNSVTARHLRFRSFYRDQLGALTDASP